MPKKEDWSPLGLSLLPQKLDTVTSKRKNFQAKKFFFPKKFITKNDKGFISQSELYSDFRYWYKESGLNNKSIPTRNNVTKYLNKTLCNLNNKSGVNGWNGFQLKSMNIIDNDDEM